MEDLALQQHSTMDSENQGKIYVPLSGLNKHDFLSMKKENTWHQVPKQQFFLYRIFLRNNILAFLFQ